MQVSVADLRIRQAPSTSAPSAGMIEKGIHTITETVEADGYTWASSSLAKVGSRLNLRREWKVLIQLLQIREVAG